MQPPDPFVLDRRAVRAAFDRASATYDAAAVLQTRVREELLSRLDLIRITPEVVVDLGCGTGRGRAPAEGPLPRRDGDRAGSGAGHAARNAAPQRLAAAPAARVRRCLPAAVPRRRRST